MISNKLLDGIKGLDTLSLYELDKHIHSLIGYPRVTYIQRPSLCGQPRCKRCREDKKGHGMYWFAKFRYEGRQYMVYVGKEKKAINVKEVIRNKKKQSRKGGK